MNVNINTRAASRSNRQIAESSPNRRMRHVMSHHLRVFGDATLSEEVQQRLQHVRGVSRRVVRVRYEVGLLRRVPGERKGNQS